MYWRVTTIVLLLLAALGSAWAGKLLSCKDARGKLLFTDDARKCALVKGESQREVTEVTLREMNSHSQYGETVSEEYYNYLYRAYEKVPGYSIEIIAEKKLIDQNPDVLARAARKLEASVKSAMTVFPSRIRPEFSGVKYYLFSGEESQTGGRKGGQWYFRKGTPGYAPFWNSIVIRSAEKYLTKSEDWAEQVAVHELSHAYYHYHRNRLWRYVNKAFKNAQENELYLNVSHENGGRLKQAYAMTNEREYFADLSKIYHMKNYYYPFRASDLKEYDRAGYDAIIRAFYTI